MFEDRHSVHIVTELVNGIELYTLCNMGKSTENKSKQLIKDVLKAVSALHELNIIHRDIKPENLLYDQ